MATQRPSKLLAVSIIAIIMGGMGVLGTIGGCFSLIGNLTGVTMQGTQSFSSPELDAAQAAMLAAVNAWMPAQIIAMVLTLILGLLLVLGAALILMNKPSGGRTLRLAFQLGIAIEFVRWILVALQMWFTYPATAAYMEATTAAASAGGPDMGGLMDSFMMVGVIAGVVFSGLWLLIKLVIYIVSLRVLGSEEVQDHFLELMD